MAKVKTWLLDNFEGQFGYAKKFGLVSVDFENEKLPRIMKPLGEVYGDMCRMNAVSSGSPGANHG